MSATTACAVSCGVPNSDSAVVSATARSSARPVPDLSASEKREGARSGNTSESRSNVASGRRRRAWRSTTRSTKVAITSSISSHTTNGKNVRGRSVNFVTVSTANVAATKGMRNVSALTAKANPRRGRHRLSSIPETSLRAEPPVADVPSFAAVPGSATLTLDSSGARPEGASRPSNPGYRRRGG